MQITLFSALVLATRCANYPDVFVDGKVYFVDADCYSRMTRARIVSDHPGTIVRQQDFENYPDGINPHTTAPLDYLIVALATLLRTFTAQPLDLAGAVVSPLLALAGGWFLWWWSRRFSTAGRFVLLLVYALSGILAHAAALGRPDQQSLLLFLLFLALAAEWQLQESTSRGWSVLSGLSWGLALWVSLYEPLILLCGLLLFSAFSAPARLLTSERLVGWWVFLGTVLLAAAVERRWPEWPGSEPFFASWSATIGELRGVGLTSSLWWHWLGGLLLVGPVLLTLALRRGRLGWPFLGLLLLCFGLTLWQARWGYFCAAIFLFTIPAQLSVVRRGWLAGGVVILALLPFSQFWDTQIWPNEEALAGQIADRREMVAWRAGASALASKERAPILAPWWLAPATAYWSGQPVVAGSSHESLPGIVATARFFLARSPAEAAEILQRRPAKWVLAANADRVVANSAAILGQTVPEQSLAWTLDHSPSQAPNFLVLTGQNEACKVYQTKDLP
ncbi:MAG: hypothetical protein ABIR38_01820 [Chthoniobacterales bacterium]